MVSIKDEIIENLDIKKLASNASDLDVDDAVDVVEEVEQSKSIRGWLKDFFNWQ